MARAIFILLSIILSTQFTHYAAASPEPCRVEFRILVEKYRSFSRAYQGILRADYRFGRLKRTLENREAQLTLKLQSATDKLDSIRRLRENTLSNCGEAQVVGGDVVIICDNRAAGLYRREVRAVASVSRASLRLRTFQAYAQAATRRARDYGIQAQITYQLALTAYSTAQASYDSCSAMQEG